MWLKRLLLVAGMLVALGCGREETQTVAPPQSQIKPTLESVAQTGTIDSGLITVREELEAMKATDSAKAETLLKDLDELERMASNPAGAKAKAQEMLGKL